MTAPGRVHIVGAGIAGLAAAARLSGDARPVTLYEATEHAGGRCRSFFDSELGCRIDNGNHLLLTGNTAALAYIERIGALDTFERPAEATVPFVDVVSGRRWELRPNAGAVPWWLFDASRRVPGTRAADYLEALRLRRAPACATVAAVLDPRTLLYRRLWQPLAVAALNTSAEQGSARLFWQVLVETLGRGGMACRALVPRLGLSESLIDPALAFLRRGGAEIHLFAAVRRAATDEVCAARHRDSFRFWISAGIDYDRFCDAFEPGQSGKQSREIFPVPPGGNDDADAQTGLAIFRRPVHFEFFKRRFRARSSARRSEAVKLLIPCFEILSNTGSMDSCTFSGSTTRRGVARGTT